MTNPEARTRAGLLLGLGAFLMWGVLPIYFKALAHVGALEILSQRVVWSLLFVVVLATLWRRWPAIRAAITSSRVALTLALTAALIGANWLVFIYAVVEGHVLEASLGYFLNPLVNIVLGVVLLKEPLSRFQRIAVFLAAAGVAVLAAGAGGAIWISLALPGTFALYGFLRKVAPVDSLEGLLVETVFLMPLALGWLIWLHESGTGSFLEAPVTDLLLILGGALTAIPLLLFTAAAKRLPYSTLGFLQYLAPSIQFLLAVLAFGERLTTAHIVCFAAIWTALAVFIAESVRMSRPAAG